MGSRGTWAASNGHASPAVSVGWDMYGEAVMPDWDASGYGGAARGGGGGGEEGDGWGGAWDSLSAARADTSEDAALAAKLQVPDQTRLKPYSVSCVPAVLHRAAYTMPESVMSELHA